MDAQIAYRGGGDDIIVSNPSWCLGNVVLSLTRGTPDNLRLCSIKLQAVTPRPQRDLSYTRRHLQQKLCGICRYSLQRSRKFACRVWTQVVRLNQCSIV